jgi:hypothetical protein
VLFYLFQESLLLSMLMADQIKRNERVSIDVDFEKAMASM